MNSLPKTVTRQRRDCDLNPGPSAPESSTLTTRLPSYPGAGRNVLYDCYMAAVDRHGRWWDSIGRHADKLASTEGT